MEADTFVELFAVRTFKIMSRQREVRKAASSSSLHFFPLLHFQFGPNMNLLPVRVPVIRIE